MVSARHGGDHVPGTLSGPGRHVLGQPEHADHVGPGLAPGKRLHGAEHGGGAAHVPFHLLHAGGRLEGETAGIEAHALADQRDRRLIGRAAGPAQRRDARLARAALADREQRLHTETLQRGAVVYLDFQAKRRPKLATRLSESLGRQHVGGLGDQIAAVGHPGDHRGRRAPRRFRRGRLGQVQGELCNLLGALFVRLLGRTVLVEPVAAQTGAGRQADRQLRRARLEIADDLHRNAGLGNPQPFQLDGEAAAERFQIVARRFLGLAQAQHDEPVELEPRRIAQINRFAALEVAAHLPERPRQGASRLLVQLCRGGPQGSVTACEDHPGTGGRKGGGCKCNSHQLSSPCAA